MSVFRKKKQNQSHKSRKRYSKDFKQKVVKEYVSTDKNARQVAEEYDVSTQSTVNWIKKAGFEVAKYPSKYKQKIIDEYLNTDKTYAELCCKYGVHSGTIAGWVQDFEGDD